MFGLTVRQAAAICGGVLENGENDSREITRAVIDSRDVRNGDMFVAYRGSSVDGHRFITTALKNGAACALAEYLPEDVTGPVIVVGDVQTALERIAAEFRRSLTIPVIGITGSVGKTTAKEMVASVLSQRFCVCKTKGNMNNTIGVPVTVSGIERENTAAVIEMGINHFGEMSHLGAVAAPDIMLFTAIGHAHLEFLHDLQGVLAAKTEVLGHMSEDALVIVNGDDETLKTLNCCQKVMTFGTGDECDVCADEIEISEEGCSSCRISYGERRISVTMPAFGRHMIYAALEGASVGFALGLSDEEIAAGISGYRTVGRRFALNDTGYIKLIDDCYNANPDSMKSSIASLMDVPGRHVCILGDMLELGGDSERMHTEIGSFAREKGVDCVLCCGRYASSVVDGAGDIAVSFESKETLADALPEYIRKGDSVLVKASLGSHLESVSERLSLLKIM